MSVSSMVETTFSRPSVAQNYLYVILTCISRKNMTKNIFDDR